MSFRPKQRSPGKETAVLFSAWRALAHLVVAELLVIVVILLQEGVELDDVGVLQ